MAKAASLESTANKIESDAKRIAIKLLTEDRASVTCIGAFLSWSALAAKQLRDISATPGPEPQSPAAPKQPRRKSSS